MRALSPPKWPRCGPRLMPESLCTPQGIANHEEATAGSPTPSRCPPTSNLLVVSTVRAMSRHAPDARALSQSVRSYLSITDAERVLLCSATTGRCVILGRAQSLHNTPAYLDSLNRWAPILSPLKLRARKSKAVSTIVVDERSAYGDRRYLPLPPQVRCTKLG